MVVQPSYPLYQIRLLDSTDGPNQVVIEFDSTDVSSCGVVTSMYHGRLFVRPLAVHACVIHVT